MTLNQNYFDNLHSSFTRQCTMVRKTAEISEQLKYVRILMIMQNYYGAINDNFVEYLRCIKSLDIKYALLIEYETLLQQEKFVERGLEQYWTPSSEHWFTRQIQKVNAVLTQLIAKISVILMEEYN